MKFKSDIEVQAGLKDSSGSNGTTGQILSSNGTTVSWVPPGASFASDVQNEVKAGVAIGKGQAVYVTSADGTNIIVGLASNTSEATSSKTLGLLDATVAANGFANVIQIGRLEGLNTSAATIGDPVWLGTGGNLIYGLVNKPYAPAHLVFIGIVTRVNANNGEIFVKVQNGFELNEIHDVDLKTTLPSGNDILAFEGAPVNLWKNKTIASVLGYTPYNASNPAGYISTYTETDTLASVTARGASTSILSTFDGGLNIGNAKLRWGGSTTPTLGLPFSGSTNAFWIDVNDGDTGGLMVDNEGVTVYGAGDNGYVFRVIDEDVYQSTLNVGSSTTFQITQGQNGGGFIKGNFDISGYTTIGGSAYLASGNSLFFDSGVTNDYSIRKNGTALQFDSAGDFTFNKGVNILTTRDNALVLRAMDGGTNPWNYIEYVNSAGTRKYYVGTDTSNVFNIWSDDGTGYVASNTSFRAPIFYDSNNTSYYGDFGSTSNSLYLAGQIYTTKSTGTLISVNGADTIGYNSTTGGAYLKGTGNSYIYGGGLYFDGSVNQTLIHTGNIGSYAVPSSRTITINGTSYDLSADRSWTVTASETDTLQTVTSRGNVTSTPIILRTSYPYLQFEDNVTGSVNFAWQQLGVTLGGSGTNGGGYFTTYSQSKPFGWTVGTNQGVMTIDTSGNVQALTSSRAPIFYDSNNTGYYLNPFGQSIFGSGDQYVLRLEHTATQGDFVDAFYVQNNESGGRVQIGMSSNGSDGQHHRVSLRAYKGSGNYEGTFGIALRQPNTSNVQRLTLTSPGDLTVDSSMRAPIFYDSNDTSYYADFNSTSNDAIRVRGGSYHGPNPTWGAYLLVGGDGRNGYMNNTLVASVCATDGNLHMDAASGKNMYLNYYDGATIYLGNGAESIIGTMDTSGNFSVSSSHRSPIFYDSNNTGYYVDPASTSSLNVLSMANKIILGSFPNSVVNNGEAWIGRAADRSAGTMTVQLGGNLDRKFEVVDYGWTTVNFSVNGYGAAEASGSMRAPIFYDSNNTGYYIDGASTSKLNALTLSSLASDDGMIENNTGGYFHLGGWGVGRTAATAVLVNTAYRADIADNATYATSAGNADTVDGFHGDTFFRNLGFGSGYPSWNANTIDESRSGFTYANGAPHSGCIAHFGASGYGIQLNGNYGGDTFAMRSRNGDNGTWRPWKTLYTDYNMDAPNKSGTSYYQTNTWMQFNGSYGLYWPSNYGAHLHANDLSSYTQLALRGNKNGYGGFYDQHSAVNGFMYDSAGNGGIYREANGRWYLYHHVGNNCTAISTSTTSSSYRAYVGGSLYAEGDIVAYSDRRKKENIATVDGALDKVNKLRGVYYNRIDDDTKKRQVGVIAQEIQEILPEVVTYAEDVDEYGVSYGNITGLLIEAIKEQQTQIEELKELVKTLINK